MQVCRAAAERVVAGLEHVLVKRSPEARSLFGRSVDAVVLDATRELDVDALGIAHGAVRAGGALVVCLSERDEGNARLAIEPFAAADVGRRFRARFFARLEALGIPVLHPDSPLPMLAPVCIEAATADQDACVRALVERLRRDGAAPVVVTAHRGRGKSAALGLAARELVALGRSVAVTGPSEASVAEVVRFGAIEYVAPSDAAHAPHDVLLIDEAAAIPVPLLRALVRPCVAFATTVHGYEGTGRGFSLRVRPLLRERFGSELLELALQEPIRFAPDDPLERAVFDLLALDASAALPVDGAIATLSKDDLAGDERILRGVFGLLVDAHYRTTPSDLERMLDAPNLEVRTMGTSAVALVAREGRLSSERIRGLAEGRSRIRGHALAELFVCHLGIEEAAALDLRRIVRIAAHPERRRRGLGATLARSIDGDLAGALFGADADLARFWIAAGFSLVHVGTARGSRSGEPSLAFVRAVSEAARPIVTRASARAAAFARFYGRDPAFMLDRDLSAVLEASLGEPCAPDPAALRAYAYGPRPFETVLVELDGLARERDLGDGVLAWRVRDRLDWPEVALRAGVPLKTAMRRARAETRALLERTVP